MSVEFFFRLAGMLLFGLGGFYLGQALVRAGGISPNDGVAAIVVTIVASGFIGFVITPFLTTRPYRALQQRIKQTPATDLLAAVTGLVLGLLIAVLLSFPLSLLPSPLREVLPMIAAVVFGLLGMSTLIGRRRDFAQLSPADWLSARPTPRLRCWTNARFCWTRLSSSTGVLPTSVARASSAASCSCRVSY